MLGPQQTIYLQTKYGIVGAPKPDGSVTIRIERLISHSEPGAGLILDSEVVTMEGPAGVYIDGEMSTKEFRAPSELLSLSAEGIVETVNGWVFAKGYAERPSQPTPRA